VHGLYGTRAAANANAAPANGSAAKAPAALGAVYVGAGIGAAIMPLRIGERGKREVTIFELGQAPGSFAEHHAEQEALNGRKPSAELVEKRAAAVARKKEKRARKRTSEWSAS
jgi:hypothetical protein